MKYKILLVFIAFSTARVFSQSGICLTPSFTNNTWLRVITVNDFNNDGIPDIAGASSSSHIAVYFGTGIGSFTLNSTYHAAPITTLSADHQVTSGDFNNDGWTDLATGNFYGLQPDVSILLNNGNGSFTTAVGITAGTSSISNGPVAITATDINNDGNIDLAVVAQAEIYTLLGTGTGSFITNTVSITGGLGHGGPHTAGIISDHFNSDSYKDVACGFGSSVAVMYGTSSGSLTAPVYYSGSDQISSSDFNNDGYRDLASSACILLGSSSGGFSVSATYSFASQPWGVTAGDFDNDGNADVAVQTATAMYFLHGRGNGQVSNTSVKSVNTGMNTIRAVDVNGDTRPDIITAGNQAPQTTLLNGSFPVSVTASPTNICAGNLATLAVTGAASTQTWSHGPTSASAIISPTGTATYSVAVTGTTGCSVTQTVQVVVNTPTLQITASSQSVCAGETVTLSASGAQSYTWSTGPSVPVVTFAPTSSTTYSVAGTNSAGCTNLSSVLITVSQPPLLSIQAPSQYCSGSTVTLTAAGASTYTWLPTTITGSAAVLSPTGTSTYTASGTDSVGCVGSAIHVIVEVPNPLVTISGSTTQCAGFSQTLSASGANQYVWSNNSLGPQVVINPLANICYSVIGTDINGCMGDTSFCVGVIGATTSIAPSAQTVCAGSSANFTAATASSYTWSGGINTSTLNVLAPTATVVTVTVTAANGCTATATASYYINTGCAWVWPGDANYDGTVDGFDVIEVGLSFSNTGPSRTGASNNYVAQYCAAWSGSVSTGANENHADCNGNGVVGFDDTVAIHNNFSLNHNFRAGSVAGSKLLLDHPAGGQLLAGSWNRITISIDSSAGPQTLYGTTFKMNFDYSIIVHDSIRLEFTPSFLNTGNQNIEFRKSNLGSGHINAVTTRTDKNNAKGSGLIAELLFKLRPDLQEGSSTAFVVDQTGAMSSSKDPVSMGGSMLMVGITAFASSLFEENRTTMAIYPNPADNHLRISSAMSHANFTIYDVVGRLVLKGELPETKTIDVSVLGSGTYLLKLENSRQNAARTFVISR